MSQMMGSYSVRQVENMDDRRFMDDYRRHSIVLGQRVEYRRGGTTYVATAYDIDDDGGLQVRRDDQVRETISAGEVSIRRHEN